MELKNLIYYDENFCRRSGSINISGEKIASFDKSEADFCDMSGLTALPGFIDIHTHGADGADACDKSRASFDKLSAFYARHGVTSFCPTTMTLSKEELLKIFAATEEYKGNECGAYIHGINMEGPYVSKSKCGAQNTSYIRNADLEEVKTLNEISKISLVDLAPETEGALDFARKAAEFTVCSVAHTAADYEQAKLAFENGFTHVTHFFNAMTGLNHRAPGVVGAVLENNDVTAELICDGFHLSPAIVRLAFQILGDDRCVVISDSLSSAGCQDGEYTLGGQKVFVKNGKAHLADGTIAGSTTNLFDEFKNLLSFSISFESALKACTKNPAKVIGVYDRCGSISKGKNADMIFVDEKLNLCHVMIQGKMIF
ncbi:MAG: N-acetylglucosamine-6-phosphate deacetylase [Acutalibacteraceae bacterium]